MPLKPECIIVGLAGGSASGKSTFCTVLYNDLVNTKPTISTQPISTDQYFLSAEKIPRYLSPSTGLETPDYNRPDSIDVGRLVQDLDHTSRAPEHPDIILLEGLMVLYLPEVRSRLHLRLFIELEGEKRALRRLVRNIGHSYDPIIDHDPQAIANYYLESAFVGHEIYIEPSRRYADLIIRGDGDFSRSAPMVAAIIRDRLMVNSTQ